MSRRDRLAIKRAIAAEVEDSWLWRDQNLLLGEFDQPPVEDNRHDNFASRLNTLDDAALIDMYSAVFDVDADAITPASHPASEGNWKPGYVRLFISHLSDERQFAQAVADELAVVGVHGFVAHETMAIGLPWQRQIESALRTMDAFLALVHPGFGTRQWCQQETGWTFGRAVPRFAIRFGEDPAGFLGSDQWPSMLGSSAKVVAARVSSWIGTLPDLGDTVLDGLIHALAGAGNYHDAQAAAKRIASLEPLFDEVFERINNVWWTNDQLYNGILPSGVMKPLYESHGRVWPPPKPAPAMETDAEEPF